MSVKRDRLTSTFVTIKCGHFTRMIMSSVPLPQDCGASILSSPGLKSPWTLLKSWFLEIMRYSWSWKVLSLLILLHMQGLRTSQNDSLLLLTDFSFTDKTETPWIVLKSEPICRATSFPTKVKKNNILCLLLMPEWRVAGLYCKVQAWAKDRHWMCRKALSMPHLIPKQMQGSLKLYHACILFKGNEDHGQILSRKEYSAARHEVST